MAKYITPANCNLDDIKKSKAWKKILLNAIVVGNLDFKALFESMESLSRSDIEKIFKSNRLWFWSTQRSSSVLELFIEFCKSKNVWKDLKTVQLCRFTTYGNSGHLRVLFENGDITDDVKCPEGSNYGGYFALEMLIKLSKEYQNDLIPKLKFLLNTYTYSTVDLLKVYKNAIQLHNNNEEINNLFFEKIKKLHRVSDETEYLGSSKIISKSSNHMWTQYGDGPKREWIAIPIEDVCMSHGKFTYFNKISNLWEPMHFGSIMDSKIDVSEADLKSGTSISYIPHSKFAVTKDLAGFNKYWKLIN